MKRFLALLLAFIISFSVSAVPVYAVSEENRYKPTVISTSNKSSSGSTSKIEIKVWIPNSGSKYHSKSTCSNMKNPKQVSKNDAISSGYEPCKKCYK